MKYLTCKCDMCGTIFEPLTEHIDISDWEITSTNGTGNVLMEGFDLCTECRAKFRKETLGMLAAKQQERKEKRHD